MNKKNTQDTTNAPAPKARRSPGKKVPAKARKAAYGTFGNRGTSFPEAWRPLAEAYGGVGGLAEEVGVSPGTLYRWAVNGDPVPPSRAKLVGLLAAVKGVKNPLA